MQTRAAPILALILLCSGCSDNSASDGVGGVSASEARALNDAAEMLDKRAPAPMNEASAAR